MSLGIRGSNPIWAEFDLTGKIFDDTYYLWILENEIPYIPATVYHDPDLNVPWTNPIQFLGNGTLPVDIFYVPGTVYRLEFRQNDGISPPSQSDALIYLVENYIPGSGGETPIDTVGFSSENQISNPQFALVDFVSPFTFSGTDPAPIQIGPDWFLELAGTGTVTLTQVPLNNSNANPSNAPYALEITLNGWTSDSVFLRQRFFQNGMLWADKIVSTAITARVQGIAVTITATLVDSNSALLAQLLSTPVDGSFNEFTGYGQLEDTTNPNTPPAAYIDYKLALPSNVDIYVTSIQLIVQDMPFEPSFTQDSINRQLDHTFHYYQNSLLMQSKDDIAVGWNFALNPWQIRTRAATTILSNGYITDQTILSMQNPGSLSVSRATNGTLAITTVAATTQQNFAIIQYIDPLSILPYWNTLLSSLTSVSFVTSNGTLLNVKMKLIVSTSLPSVVDPIASWSSNEPVFTGQWTAINPINSPVNVLSNGTSSSFAYNGFQLPASSGATQMLGIVFYTTNAMDFLDVLTFKQISLVPNDFAIASSYKTADQVLRDCYFYFESSYAIGVLFGTASAGGSLFSEQLGIKGATDSVRSRGFGFPFKQISRTTAPNVTLFSPITGTTGAVNANIFQSGVTAGSGNATVSSFWSTFLVSSTGITYICINNTPILSAIVTSADTAPEGFITYHYTKDARLGLFN